MSKAPPPYPTEVTADTQASPFRERKVLVIYILGGPGVGKGTQCQKLVQDFGFGYFSVGDLLREEKSKPGSNLSTVIDQHMRQGTIVPVEITMTLIRNTMLEEMAKGYNTFLIDGFPRTMEQVLLFESEICNSGVTLNFDCSPGVMLQRVLNRGKTSQRVDDNEESFWKRWDGYKSDTVPVLDYFRKRDQVITINCEGPLESGYTEVKKAVEDFMARHLATRTLSPKSEDSTDG